MVTMPAAEEAFDLTEEHPDLGVGVHLVFTAGRPDLPSERVSTLINKQGRFLDQHLWIRRIQKIDLAQLKAELRAQIECFMERRGKPTHLDCHHFVHVYPPIFAILVELAAEYGLPMRVPFGQGWQAMAEREASRFGVEPDEALEMVRRNLELVEKRGVACPDHFVSEFFGEDNIGVENLLAILVSLEEGVTELMCHPGHVDEKLLRTSGYAQEREKELETLTDPQVQRAMDRLGIELINFGDLEQS